MEERRKLYKKWWLWVCIALIILMIKFSALNYINNVVVITSENLNKKVIMGNLTYYIEDDWKTEESSSDNTIYKYYYPTSNTMIMVMFEKDGNYGDNSNIDSIFLDSYISGMNLEDKDIISQEIKIINNVRCGVIRCYINDYEFIQ